MKMPNPIAIRFAKLILAILTMTVLGVILAMISHDHKLLILSAGIAIAGRREGVFLLPAVSKQQYRVSRGSARPRAGQYSQKTTHHCPGTRGWKPRTAGAGWTI